MGEPAARPVEAEASERHSLRGGPTVLRITVGSRLRRLREARGITVEEAGYSIRASQSKISRLELGRIGFKERDVADLLTLYGVSEGAEREQLLEMARRANAPGWWHQYSDVIPVWFDAYLGLEEASSLIRSFEARYIPDLLQTREYASVVETPGWIDSPESLGRRVDLKMRRQRLIHEPDAPTLWFVIDEAVLHRELGGREVMSAQLEHLLELSLLPNVTLQILPSRAPRRVSVPFSVIRFSDPWLSDVIYAESLNSASYLDRPSDVDAFIKELNSLAVDSWSPDFTQEVVHRALADYR